MLASSVDSGTQVAKRPIALLIADESPLNCQLLKNVFARSRSSFHVVACAVSLAEILDSLNARQVDIALVSESLEDGPFSGFSVLEKLRTAFPKTRAIALLKSAREELVINAFRAGAKGVFHRAAALEQLCKCVSAVHEGQIWANSTQLGAVLNAFAGTTLHLTDFQGKALLTNREEEVVKLVVEGYANREVAKKLGLSKRTVGNYLIKIYDKLGISGRVELVLYSMKSR